MVYIVYRFILAGYVLGWLIYNFVAAPGAELNNDQESIVFLTTWSYILLNLHLWISFFDVTYMAIKLRRNGTLKSMWDVIGHQDWQEARAMEISVIPTTDKRPHNAHRRGPDYRMTWYHGLLWVIHDMISGAAPVVSIIYFAALYPSVLEENPELAASALDINIHGINSVIMVLENFVAAIPVRLLHIIYPMIYGLVYVAWSVIYFYMDPENNVLYVKLLDWNYPEITIPVILGVLFLMMPLIQLFWFGCYRLRLTIFQKCYHYRYCDPDTM